jgi:hypothetical protein
LFNASCIFDNTEPVAPVHILIELARIFGEGEPGTRTVYFIALVREKTPVVL